MPDAMETIFKSALALGKRGGVSTFFFLFYHHLGFEVYFWMWSSFVLS